VNEPEVTMRQYYKAMLVSGLACSYSNIDELAKEAGRLADALIAEDKKHEDSQRTKG
jgi:hypothetical protein